MKKSIPMLIDLDLRGINQLIIEYKSGVDDQLLIVDDSFYRRYNDGNKFVAEYQTKLEEEQKERQSFSQVTPLSDIYVSLANSIKQNKEEIVQLQNNGTHIYSGYCGFMPNGKYKILTAQLQTTESSSPCLLEIRDGLYSDNVVYDIRLEPGDTKDIIIDIAGKRFLYFIIKQNDTSKPAIISLMDCKLYGNAAETDSNWILDNKRELGGIRIQCTDQDGGPLAGVEYTISQDGSEQTYTVVSDQNGLAATGRYELPLGNYVVKESKTPKGYIPENSLSIAANADIVGDYQTQAVISEHKKSVTLLLKNKVVLEGGDIKPDMFTFELRTYDQPISSIKNKQGGIIQHPITFSSAGTWVFTLQQIAGSDPLIEYDNRILTYTIVIEEKDGLLQLKSSNVEPSGGFMNKVIQDTYSKG